MPTDQDNDIRISTGAHLRHLREEKALSIADVAAQLYLDPGIIAALEGDDYDALPSATYVRGYLRSYAKVLAVPADAILALYDADAPSPPEIIPQIKLKTQTTSRDKPVIAFSYLVVFILMLLSLAWWQSRFIQDGHPLTDLTAPDPSETDNPSPGLPYPITIVEHTDAPFYRAPSVDESPKAGDALDVTPPGPDTAGVSPPAITVAIDKRGTGPDTIKISLSGNCWIEVFDVNDERVYLDLARAGQTLLLRGIAPFSVKLGSSQSAMVEFNGVAFDHAGYSRAGVARFVLGAE